jgi:hypothetical protein
MVHYRYLPRACLVNFRTREQDLDILLDLFEASGKTGKRNGY